MSDHPKFFSEDWCQSAVALRTQAMADAELKAVKNPDKFDHVLAFEITDRPDTIVHLEYKGAQLVGLSATALAEESLVWVRFRGNLDVYREAVNGPTSASNLVLRGKLKLAKGSITDAIKNAKPLNVVTHNWWGAIPTDWDA